MEDSACIIRCTTEKSTGSWLDVLKDLLANREVVFSHMLRAANSAADSLAKDGIFHVRLFDL